jgi:molybdenum cofactor cytidylyltransferase
LSASVAAIVLAAGGSTRLGQPKQLLMHAGETLVARAIRFSAEAGADQTIIVLGAHAELICSTVDLKPAVQVVNSRWHEGIATSIHAGLQRLDAVAPETEGVLIMSCDQPQVTVDHLRTLIESFVAQAEPSIVASAYAGVLGIPALFPRMAFQHLRGLSGDKGARALLAEPPCPVIAVECPGGEIDIDTPVDLTMLQ